MTKSCNSFFNVVNHRRPGIRLCALVLNLNKKTLTRIRTKIINYVSITQHNIRVDNDNDNHHYKN